jgi:hypothetical protein
LPLAGPACADVSGMFVRSAVVLDAENSIGLLALNPRIIS